MLYHWTLETRIAADKLPLYTTHIAPGTHPALQFHDHNVSEIVFVLSGEGEHVIQIGKQVHRTHISARDVLVIHPGLIHAYDKTDNLEIFNLVYDWKKLAFPMLDGYDMPLFSRFFPRGLPLQPQEMLNPVMTLTAEEQEQVVSRLKELQLQNAFTVPGSLCSSLALFMRLLTMMGQMRLNSPGLHRQPRYQIGNALFLMGRRYASGITLDELARSVNMSRRNFCRQFRLMTGTSPIQYLQQLKMRHAVELLESTEMDLSSIASQCGFYDSNFFCKQFHKFYHKSPGEYRREHHQNKLSLNPGQSVSQS